MADEFIQLMIANKDDITLPEMHDTLTTGINPQLISGHMYSRGIEINMHGVNINTVMWLDNAITTYRIDPNRDTLSFKFSGCSMAIYRRWFVWYAAHIGAGENYDKDRRKDWIEYINQERISKLRMFRPDYQYADTMPNAREL